MADADLAARDARRKERARNIRLGADLVLKNAAEAIVIYTDPADGGFYFTTNKRTWAMGAVRRTTISLDERERIDTRRIEDSEGEDHGD